MFSDRLRQFIEHTGKSINAFEISIGVSKGTILKPIKNGKTVGAEVLDKIISTYPALNLEWLVSGIGEMIKKTSGVEKEESKPRTETMKSNDYISISKDEFIDILRKANKNQDEEIKDLQQQLERTKNH